ncbi:MAG: hypothetical protein ACTHNW_05545 [Mucilaginibacter sp.]
MADILGTIVASVLNYKTINGGHDGCDPLHSAYAPCDGRPIAGSALAKLGIATAPDLRGRFLRGLNLFYSIGEPGGFDINKANPDDPNRDWEVGTYQDDAFQGHWHDKRWSDGPASRGREPNNTEDNNQHNGFYSTELTIIDPITDGRNGIPRTSNETRPKNVAVYYYIKIN